MKVKLLSFALMLAIIVAALGVPGQVQAASYGASFVTSITYQNVGDSQAIISIDFYPGNGSPAISMALDPLAAGAASSLYVGSVSGVSSGFKGSAVMSSSQPLITTLVQVPQGTGTLKNRPLSSGFSTGAAYVLIPTVLKNTFASNSVFTVQNVDTVPNQVVIKFVPISGSAVTRPAITLGVGEAAYFDLGKDNLGLATQFNGSVQINATKAGQSTGGSVVATSVEFSTNSDSVYAFEGASTDGNVLYMPSAFCKYRGGLVNSFYAVQNTSTSANAIVNVVYSSGKTDGPYTIAPGAKDSFPGCGKSGSLNAAGFIGSAKITSTGGKIVGVGKITGAGNSTAFLGVASGASSLSLPYVRWGNDAGWNAGSKQRTNIAVQNVGASTLAAGSVKIKYYDYKGTLIGTDTNAAAIPVGGKISSNPAKLAGVTEFGYYGSTIGGAAVVIGPNGSQLAAIARVETYIGNFNSVGEDYNGVPFTLVGNVFNQ